VYARDIKGITDTDSGPLVPTCRMRHMLVARRMLLIALRQPCPSMTLLPCTSTTRTTASWPPAIAPPSHCRQSTRTTTATAPRTRSPCRHRRLPPTPWPFVKTTPPGPVSRSEPTCPRPLCIANSLPVSRTAPTRTAQVTQPPRHC
jgi:hypothetical protein